MNKNEVVTLINELEGYEGYVQFSNRPIEGKWCGPIDEKEEGFVYEAHFCNGKESLAIRQINDVWLLSRTDISDVPEEDKQTYESKFGKVIMAQKWEDEKDELCENMFVKRLKKVVFAGFAGGEK